MTGPGSGGTSIARTATTVTSEAVLNELARGAHPAKAAALALMDDVPLLAPELPVDGIVQAYIDRKVMPADPTGDALHLALASYHGCDFPRTWNCRHIANANKFDHIAAVNADLGLPVPRLVTPLQLLSDHGDPEPPR